MKGTRRRGARPVRQGARRARCARIGDAGRAAARPRMRRRAWSRSAPAPSRRRPRPRVLCDEIRALRPRVRWPARIGCRRAGISRRISRRRLLQGAGRARGQHARCRRAAIRDARRCASISPNSRRAASRTARIVVLDNATGDVLAYVGSSGELSARRAGGRRRWRRGRRARRSSRSSTRWRSTRALLTAASLVDDSPLAIATERGMYVPQNYDRDFRGLGQRAHRARRARSTFPRCARSAGRRRSLPRRRCARWASTR